MAIKGIKYILTLMLLFSVSASYCQRQVKKRTEINVSYPTKHSFSKKKYTRKENYVVYDRQGREMEFAMFGESFHTSVVNKDSTITMYCGEDESKIGSLDISVYDTNGRKIKEENWFCKNNKKDVYSGYKLYQYNEQNLLYKERRYSLLDSSRATLENIVTYVYDKNKNNTEEIDSDYSSFYAPKNQAHIHKTINQYDDLKNLDYSAEYSDGKLLLRKKYLYRDYGPTVTELRYDNESDASLWSITETTYGDLDQDPYPRKKLEEFWKVINSSSEYRKIYIYNKDCLLIKIEESNGITLGGCTKFEYEYY